MRALGRCSRRALAAVALVAVVGACADDAADGTETVASTADTADTAADPAGTSETAGTSDAAAYCTDNCGTVETRTPYWGTNLDRAEWVQLAGSLELCAFADPEDPDVRIYVDTVTLAAEVPTLAAAAYLAKVPVDGAATGANPAAVGCDDVVQGTSSWGTSMSAGGWVNDDDPVFTVVDLCVFPDRSAIDQWGITYYSGGVVRGRDLAELFRFDPAVVADIFPQ